jgi:formiminotetrahydrofolate cyclodeaminase
VLLSGTGDPRDAFCGTRAGSRLSFSPEPPAAGSVDGVSDDDIDPAVTPLSEWLDRLAQAHGAPGGGAASAVMTAISAALLGMVAAYTAHDSEARMAAQRLAVIRRAAATAAEEDGIRSADFGTALALDKGAAREHAVRKATVDAITSSLTIGRLAASLVDEVRLLARIGNPHVEADLLVAVEALRAALHGADVTARADLDLLAKHRSSNDGLDAEFASLERGIGDLARTLSELEDTAAYRRSGD